MNPGELNCRVSIMKAVNTQDAEGNIITKPYTERFKCWAKLQAFSARVRQGNAEDYHEIMTRITIRYNSTVKQTDRIVYGSRIFEQVGPPINVDEKKAYLRLECREVVENG